MDCMTIKLSQKEQDVYDLLPMRRSRDSQQMITTSEIVKLIYGRKVPFHGQKIISGIVRTLERKTEGNKIRVRRGIRSGPHPVGVWKERT